MDPNGDIARFTRDRVEDLRDRGLSWEKVADRLGVTRRTLYNMRRRGIL